MEKPSWFRFLAIIFMGILFLTGCGGGGSSGGGAKTVTVTGQLSVSGVAVAQNTSLRLESTSNSSVSYTTTTTNSTGNFSISSVTPGNYYIYFSPTGYTDLTDGLTKVVTVAGPNNFQVDISLPPAPPGP